jgi:hypothetical protein
MDAADANDAVAHRLENAFHQTNANSVTELDVFEAEVADFTKHRRPVGVMGGIPAGGKS